MAASIEEIVSGSYLVWRKNKVMGVPFLLGGIISLLLVLATIAFMIFFANPLPKPPYDYMSLLKEMNWALVAFDVALLIALIFILWLIQSFITAGAIGMAKKALETGKTGLDDMIEAGKKHAIKIYLADIIIAIVTIIGVIVMIVLSFILGGQYTNIFAIIIGIIFAPIPYAIVYSGRGVREGLKRGINLALDNKLETTALYATTTAITSIVSIGGLLIAAAIMSLAFIALPSNNGNIQYMLMAAASRILLLLGALALAVIAYIIIMFFIAAPLVTTCWANYYQSRGKKDD